MKRLLVFLLLSACSFAQTNTEANLGDGNRLVRDCGAAVKSMDDGIKGGFGADWCVGYMVGFMDGMNQIALLASDSYPQYTALWSKYVCTPKDNTIGQDIRVQWLKDHPERLHENASFLTFRALRDGYGGQCEPATAPLKTAHASAK